MNKYKIIERYDNIVKNDKKRDDRRLVRGYIMSVILFIIIMFATAFFELIKRS